MDDHEIGNTQTHILFMFFFFFFHPQPTHNIHMTVWKCTVLFKNIGNKVNHLDDDGTKASLRLLSKYHVYTAIGNFYEWWLDRQHGSRYGINHKILKWN